MTKTKTKPPKKVEPLKQPASKEYKLLSIDTEKMPVELSQAERDRCAIELAELEPFAVWGSPGFAGRAFAEELAAREVMCLCTGGGDAAFVVGERG